MGENHFAPTPTAVYGFVLLMAAIAYYLLQRAIIAHEGRDSLLARGTRQRLEGQALAPDLSRRHAAGLRQHLDLQRPLRRPSRYCG